MFHFNKNLIFRKIFIDTSFFFLMSILTIGTIVWIIQAVNYLDFVTEDGHSLEIYFKFTLLNLPKIIIKIFPIIFFISLFYITTRYEDNNELKIFWITGISKKTFVQNVLQYTFFLVLILSIFKILLIPSFQNKARVYIQNSNIDFFPSLLKDKKFIDTVNNLTIYIDKRSSPNEFEKIFLKEENNGDQKIIFANYGSLVNNDSQKLLRLTDGKIININQKEILVFNFENTFFDLNKYVTNSTIDFKIQEKNTISLMSCYINFYLKNQKKYFDPNNCNDQAVKEIQSEMYKRLVKPFYLFILSLTSCVLIFNSKENSNSRNIRIKVFFFGFIVIVISELFNSYAGLNIPFFLITIIFPIIVSLILYKKLVNKDKNIIL